MKNLSLSIILCLVLSNSGAAEINRYLYLSIPDGAQQGDAVEPGVYVFDIDNGHTYVRFIPVPSFETGLRGFCPSLANRAAFYTAKDGLIGRLDLEKDEVTWERNHDRGWDRACITRDGKTLFAPMGFWHRIADGGFSAIDPENGDILDTAIVGSSPHNSLITLDGEYMLIAGRNWLDVIRVAGRTPVWRFSAVGGRGVFPFTVDSANLQAYICQSRHVGFEVVNLENGTKLYQVQYGDEPVERRTHGIGLTPDETEVWISDQRANQLIVFDNTVIPPVLKREIPLSRGGHGWITFSIDGRFAWCHTPDVIDTKTKKVIATLKTGQGIPIASSKFFEAHFENGKLVRVGDQFGLGMKERKPPTRNVAEP